jgi:bifunctional enzyme CysN/CysC
MSAALNVVAQDSEPEALAIGRTATLLRVLTCGSVDDGKSTLLGRLLFDSDAVLDDQLAALDRDSKRFGTQGDARDFALLVDGLSAEREQGITIDVAYRYFSTDRRSFIVADTPGHEQYTRNMATGASTADLAIILVDARKGILPQTRRHSYIVHMLGVRHVVLAVNKMDLVGFSEDAFRGIVDGYGNATGILDFTSIVAIPLCARAGDNVAGPSDRTPWYAGPPLLQYLETVSIEPSSELTEGFRLPVQWVNRPDLDFRGYAGTIAGGAARVGQPVSVLPGGRQSRIARIVTADGDLDSAVAGQPVTLTLADEIDVSRGDVIVPLADMIAARTRVSSRVLWMDEGRLAKGTSLIVKLASATANVWIEAVNHAIDIHSFTARAADSLGMNEIGVVDLLFDKPVVASDYRTDRELGAFVLIDRLTNRTVALGIIESASNFGTPTTRQRMKTSLGNLIARRDRAFWQNVASRLIGGGMLAALVLAVSGNAVAAVTVASAEALLCPVLSRLVRSAWPVSAQNGGRLAEVDN